MYMWFHGQPGWQNRPSKVAKASRSRILEYCTTYTSRPRVKGGPHAVTHSSRMHPLKVFRVLRIELDPHIPESTMIAYGPAKPQMTLNPTTPTPTTQQDTPPPLDPRILLTATCQTAVAWQAARSIPTTGSLDCMMLNVAGAVVVPR